MVEVPIQTHLRLVPVAGPVTHVLEAPRQRHAVPESRLAAQGAPLHNVALQVEPVRGVRAVVGKVFEAFAAGPAVELVRQSVHGPAAHVPAQVPISGQHSFDHGQIDRQQLHVTLGSVSFN